MIIYCWFNCKLILWLGFGQKSWLNTALIVAKSKIICLYRATFFVETTKRGITTIKFEVP